MMPLGHLGHFQVEQAADEVRVRPRQDDPHLVVLLADIQHHGPHPLIGHVRFAGNLLALGQVGLRASKVHHDASRLPSGRCGR